MAIYMYRYGKFEKLEARKEGHSYIYQVKMGIFIYIFIKNGGYSYI